MKTVTPTSSFGFNSQEKDDYIYGAGFTNHAKYWEYDTRLGRRWNLDPIVKEWESPYASFNNNPVFVIDLLGNDGKTAWALWMETHELAGETIVAGAGPEDPVADIAAGIEEVIGGAAALWELTQNAPVPNIRKPKAPIPTFPASGTTRAPLPVYSSSGPVQPAISKAKAQDIKAKQGADSKSKDPAARRVPLRKATKAKIKENQPRNANGEPIDPNDKQPLGDDETDIGHKPGHEWRTRQEMHRAKGSTRQQILDEENDPDLYHIERRSNNRSHQYEAPRSK